MRVTPAELRAFTDELMALYETGESMVKIVGEASGPCPCRLPGAPTCDRCSDSAAAVFYYYHRVALITQRVTELARAVVPDGTVESLLRLAEQKVGAAQVTNRAAKRRALRRVK